MSVGCSYNVGPSEGTNTDDGSVSDVIPAAGERATTDAAPAEVVMPTDGSAAASACVPSCRAGYVCISGRCVSVCNPPCAAGETCTSDMTCVAAGEDAGTDSGHVTPVDSSSVVPPADSGSMMPPAGCTSGTFQPCTTPCGNHGGIACDTATGRYDGACLLFAPESCSDAGSPSVTDAGSTTPADSGASVTDAATPDSRTADAGTVPDIVGFGMRVDASIYIASHAGGSPSAPFYARNDWWSPGVCLNTGTTTPAIVFAAGYNWYRCEVDLNTLPRDPVSSVPLFIGSFQDLGHPTWGDSGQIGSVGESPSHCTPTAGFFWHIDRPATGTVLYDGPSSGLPCVVNASGQSRQHLP